MDLDLLKRFGHTWVTHQGAKSTPKLYSILDDASLMIIINDLELSHDEAVKIPCNRKAVELFAELLLVIYEIGKNRPQLHNRKRFKLTIEKYRPFLEENARRMEFYESTGHIINGGMSAHPMTINSPIGEMKKRKNK